MLGVYLAGSFGLFQCITRNQENLGVKTGVIEIARVGINFIVAQDNNSLLSKIATVLCFGKKWKPSAYITITDSLWTRNRILKNISFTSYIDPYKQSVILTL